MHKQVDKTTHTCQMENLKSVQLRSYFLLCFLFVCFVLPIWLMDTLGTNVLLRFNGDDQGNLLPVFRCVNCLYSCCIIISIFVGAGESKYKYPFPCVMIYNFKNRPNQITFQ